MFLTVIIFVTNVYHLEIYVILLFIIGFLKCFILKFYSKNTFFFLHVRVYIFLTQVWIQVNAITTRA